MKKVLAILFTLAFVFTAGSALACRHCDQEADATAVANPVFTDYSSNGYGFAGGGAYGNATTDSYARGPYDAEADAYANGTAENQHGGLVIDTPNVKIGAVGSRSSVEVSGFGYATGRTGPDAYASVGVDVSGTAWQETGGYVGDGLNGFGGSQYSTSSFSAYDYDYDRGGYYWWWPSDANACESAYGRANAQGGQFGLNIQTTTSATSLSVAANSADWYANGYGRGSVYGEGTAQMVATKEAPNGGFGQVHGTASFCYSGYNYGSGVAITGGTTSVITGPNSQTVNSHSFSRASSNGGFGLQ